MITRLSQYVNDRCRGCEIWGNTYVEYHEQVQGTGVSSWLLSNNQLEECYIVYLWDEDEISHDLLSCSRFLLFSSYRWVRVRLRLFPPSVLNFLLFSCLLYFFCRYVTRVSLTCVYGSRNVSFLNIVSLAKPQFLSISRLSSETMV